MPLYLVRWPNLSAALVKASSEDELLLTLDEVADPSECTWTIYKGPVFIEFEPPAWFSPEEGHSSDDDSDEELLRPSVPCCETGSEMLRLVEEAAFPNFALVRSKAFGGPVDPTAEEESLRVTDEDIRDAANADLDVKMSRSISDLPPVEGVEGKPRLRVVRPLD